MRSINLLSVFLLLVLFSIVPISCSGGGGGGGGGNNNANVDGDAFTVAEGDCDDNDPDVNPGVAEDTYNGKDDDCDPLTLDDDLDEDGYPDATDCDDTRAEVNPGNDELCGDGLDNDCDTGVDLADAEGCIEDADNDGETNATDCDDTDPEEFNGQEWYEDADEDLYPASLIADEVCERPDANHRPEVDISGILDDLVLDNGPDCDDAQENANPGLREICFDGIDNDCDVLTLDDDLADCIIDADGDGWTVDEGDCDDNDPVKKPGQLWYVDEDDDFYPVNGTATVECDRPLNSRAEVELQSITDFDCDDTTAVRSPGNAEYCGDGIDNDCDALTLDNVDCSTDLLLTCPIDVNNKATICHNLTHTQSVGVGSLTAHSGHDEDVCGECVIP